MGGAASVAAAVVGGAGSATAGGAAGRVAPAPVGGAPAPVGTAGPEVTAGTGAAADAAAVGAAGGAGAAVGAAPAAAANPDSAEGLWVIADPVKRARKLEDYYDVPNEEMGKGHYGVVRKGVRKSDSVPVAVKTVPKRRAVYVEMLRGEVAILKALDHENIIKLYDEFEDEAQVHLVFELCTGGELFDPISDAHFRFTERQASRLVRKLLSTVAYIHERNIVHRDLKPENMLLASKLQGVESELRVIDFGLATPVRQGEVLTKHVGTPYYIAPEVLEKRYGKECDVWSTGVITFTLLCGYPPFWGDSEREIYGRVRRGTYAFDGPDWMARSAYAKDLISRMLVMIPERRITVEGALAHRWIVHEGEVLDGRSRRLIGRLRRYCQFPWLKRLALAVVARSLTTTQDQYCRECWIAFEMNEDGIMTPAHMRASLRARGLGATESEAAALVAGLDLNRDGVVTYTEFAAAVMPRLHYLSEAAVNDVFGVLDMDHDGCITFPDLQRLVGDDTFAAAVLSASDLDGDGKISLADFLAIISADEAHIL